MQGIDLLHDRVELIRDFRVRSSTGETNLVSFFGDDKRLESRGTMSRKSLDLTLSYLRALDRTRSANDVVLLLLDVLKSYGVEFALAGILPDRTASARIQLSHALINHIPVEWTKRYLSRNYIAHDPTIHYLSKSQDPFLWSDILDICGKKDVEARVLQEASEFGIRSGITIPLLTLEGCLAGASFSGRYFDVEPEQVGVLQLIATYAFARLLLLQGSAPRAPVRLTEREREVLQWSAEGKTAWEIGEILAISGKGVEYHLASSRAKLGALNGVQAVAAALRLGLIH
ncbi:autoinducer binding domain-containing protein [Methylobacterium sp. JK268]